MSHPYKDEAQKGHDRKLKAYGGQSGNAPLTHAGYVALNTDTQAGRAPLNSSKYIPPEVTPERMARKKGGRVSGADSLKRLDRAPRKGSKVPTGTRSGPIPSGTTEQVEFDPTLKFEPGAMSESSPRKRGGKVQDYEARSHESQGAQGLRPRQGHAKGGSSMHPDEREDRALVKRMVKGEALTGKKDGGSTRKHRASGGGAFDDYTGGESERSEGGKSSGRKANGKTTVNVIIPMGMGGAQGGAPMMPPGGGMPAPVPMGAPPAAAMPPAPPPMMAGPPPAPVGGPPQMPPGGMPMPMPRKDGGKVQVP